MVIFTSASSKLFSASLGKGELESSSSSSNIGNDCHCSHPPRNSHQIPSVAFTKGYGQLNVRLKSETAKQEKKGQTAAQKGSFLCGCHYSLLQSLQVSRESLVHESFRQAGPWDRTIDAHTYFITYTAGTLSQSQGCYCLPRSLLWVPSRGKAEFGKIKPYLYNNKRIPFPSAFG